MPQIEIDIKQKQAQLYKLQTNELLTQFPEIKKMHKQKLDETKKLYPQASAEEIQQKFKKRLTEETLFYANIAENELSKLAGIRYEIAVKNENFYNALLKQHGIKLN